MGSGDFGSNGSVHYRIHHHDNPANPPNNAGRDNSKRHPGHASPPPLIIGQGKAPKPDHPGAFLVTARYQSAAAAAAAFAAIRVVGTVIQLEVPVWNPEKNEANVFNDPEVSVDW